jgi:hypothetical protein
MDNENNGIGCEDCLLVWQLPENRCILQHDKLNERLGLTIETILGWPKHIIDMPIP